MMPFDTSFFRMNNIFSPDTNIGDYGSEQGVDDLVYRKKKLDPYGSSDIYGQGESSIAGNVRERLSSAFAPTARMQPDTSYQPAQSENPDDIYMRRFKEMTDTSGPAQEEYRKFIDTMPQREDYQPGKMRSFAAALAGGAAGFKDPGKGIAIAEHLRDQPYESAIQDFSLKAKGKQEAAQEERQSLTARRQLFNDVLTDRQRQALLPSQVRKNEATAGEAEAKAGKTTAETAQMPAELDIKKRKADAEIKLDEALSNLRTAQAVGTPALVAAATERANAAMLAAQAAGVTAAANTVKGAAATVQAEAARVRSTAQPTFETYHTPADEKLARSEAIKKVAASDPTYYGFAEKDKQGKLTGGATKYEKPGTFNFMTPDLSNKKAEFDRKVQAETEAYLKRNARKRKLGSTSGTPSGGTSTVSDFLNQLPD